MKSRFTESQIVAIPKKRENGGVDGAPEAEAQD